MDTTERIATEIRRHIRPLPDLEGGLDPLLERAVGVIYLPRSERYSHYFECRLPRQFDAVIHIDRTSALEPLDRVATWNPEELPETYPFGA